MWLRGNVGGEQVYLLGESGAARASSGRLTLTTQWQRFTCQMSAQPGAWLMGLGTDLRDGTQAATSAQTIYAWGAQVEQGAFPTSYIPTTSVSVTRAADVASMPTNVGWFNASAFTMQAEYFYDNATGVPLLGVSDNAFGENTCYLTTTPSGLNKGGAGGGTAVAGLGPTMNTANKSVGAFTTAQLKACVNGGGVGSFVSTMNAPSGAVRIAFGNDPWLLGSGFNCHYRRASVWNRALSDTEMQTVTT